MILASRVANDEMFRANGTEPSRIGIGPLVQSLLASSPLRTYLANEQ